MKKEVRWNPSKCVTSVLLELAKKPLTPIQLRTKTGMIKNNYANIILKKLERDGTIACLTPGNIIGKIFCIDPSKSRLVENALKKKGFKQKVMPLPDVNWEVYGRLICPYCSKLRAVLAKANELRMANREISVFNLMEKLPAMAKGDVYRALNKLEGFRIIEYITDRPKRYSITREGFLLMKFDHGILI